MRLFCDILDVSFLGSRNNLEATHTWEGSTLFHVVSICAVAVTRLSQQIKTDEFGFHLFLNFFTSGHDVLLFDPTSCCQTSAFLFS